MFGELGQMLGLLKNLPKLKEEMGKFQAKLGEITAEGTAGGDLVRVRANGRMEITGCTLGPAALEMKDKEMLEDLITAAANQALAKVREQVGREAGGVAGGLGLNLPEGFGFPGLS
jgi:nucleoid-associated protein EbfC